MIIIDDPLTPEDAHNPTAREKVKRVFRDTIISRFDNPAEARLVVTMQRLHADDLTGHLLESGGFAHLSLPAVATTAEFTNVRVIDVAPGRSTVVCGMVNARNGYGGMGGAKRFVVGGTVALEGDMSATDIDQLWARFC